MTEPFVAETVTPSGVEVRYTAGDRVRKYEVYNPAYPEKGWVEVPSVTTVLGVLDTPLHWWGMQVGVKGSLELMRMGELQSNSGAPALKLDDFTLITADDSLVVDRLTHHKLTVNHVRDKASDRGTAVHDAFEAWMNTGLVPDPDMFADEQRGYVVGLRAFIEDISKGDVEPLASEVMVASAEHGFAGRYDARFRTRRECQVIYHRTPVKGPKYATLQPGTFLGDLKSSKGVYLKHSKQLEGYEIASVEDGYDPTDARGIIHVSAAGEYEFVRSMGEADDFLTTLAEWRSQERMKKRKAK